MSDMPPDDGAHRRIAGAAPTGKRPVQPEGPAETPSLRSRHDEARPFVSVIMPVRNEAAHLSGTLQALLAGDYPPERTEVLVVDGGSTDGSRHIVREASERDPRVRLLENPQGRTPTGLNIGLRAALGDVIVRMDGHTTPAPDYVRACVDALERTNAWMVGGHMVGHGESAFGDAVARAISTPAGAGDASFRLGGRGAVDTVYLGAWRRDCFERVGGFDEHLERNQDYELALRIRRAGGTVWLDPNIRSTTVTRGSAGDLARQYFGYGTGRAATVCRHPRSMRRRQALPALFVACLVIGACAAPLFPAARRALVGLLAPYGAFVAASSLSAARGLAPNSAIRLPAVYLTIHVAWGLGFWSGLASCLAGRLRPSVPHLPQHPARSLD